MKFIVFILLLGAGFYFVNTNFIWTKEKMNKAIEEEVKTDAAALIKDLKSSPYIADANIKHDKKKCGIVLYVKMIKLPATLSQQDLLNLRLEAEALVHASIRQTNDPDIRDLRYMINKGIYIMYRFYLNNGKVFATVKLTKRNI